MLENSLNRFLNNRWKTPDKQLAKAVGKKPAIMLGYLIRNYLYDESFDYLHDFKVLGKGWGRYLTFECQEKIGLPEKEQSKAMKILVDKELAKRHAPGMPKFRYYKINKKNIMEILKETP